MQTTHSPLDPDLWLHNILTTKQVQQGGVIRRKARDVERFYGYQPFMTETTRRGFQAPQTPASSSSSATPNPSACSPEFFKRIQTEIFKRFRHHRKSHYPPPMRALALLLLASPAAAWEFSPLPVCTVTEIRTHSALIMTFDPATGLYTLSISKSTPWPNSPVFRVQFNGSRALTISTDRHTLSDDGKTLTVTDRGFGNVLNGLQYNEYAWASVDGAGIRFTLEGAADPVERFRNCGAALTG